MTTNDHNAVAAKTAASTSKPAAVQAKTVPIAAKPAVKAGSKTAAKAPAKAIAKVKKTLATTPAAKQVSKPAAKTTADAKAKTVATKPVKALVVKPAKVKKPKMVRDSLTIPKLEYEVLGALKLRAAKLASPVKKTELIRAGIKALAGMTDAALTAALRAVPSLKTGRPAKAK